MTFYVDSSFWIALSISRDQHHSNAERIMQSLSPKDQFITSEFVLIEVLNYFSERGPESRKKASALVRQFESAPQLLLVPLSHELYLRGLRLFERTYDKGWSLTECISFLIMEERSIHHALAFDSHFEQAGFQCL